MSFSGCASFLEHLEPEVCLKGDCLLRAGTTSEVMYIMMTGELQVSYPPEGNKLRKITNSLGSSRVSLARGDLSEHQRSTRVPQGRVERRGSLIGWQPPYGPMLAFRYTARAYRFSQLFSVTRSALCGVLEAHTIDAAVFAKAVEHANKLLQPTGQKGDKKNSIACCADADAFRRVSSQVRLPSPAPSRAFLDLL